MTRKRARQVFRELFDTGGVVPEALAAGPLCQRRDY